MQRALAAIPWWAWLLLGVVLALLLREPIALLVGAPAAARLHRRLVGATHRHLDERADDLERAADRLRAEAEADVARHRAEEVAVDDARRLAAERVAGAEKWDRFWALLLLPALLQGVAAPALAGDPSPASTRDASPASSCDASPMAAGDGIWVDGSRRGCIPLERYEAATPLPGGCPALRPGVLLTVADEDRRARAEAALVAEVAELRRQLAAERGRLAVARPACADRLDGGAAELRGAGDQVAAAAPPSPWTDVLLGAAGGGGAVGLAWVIVALVQP